MRLAVQSAEERSSGHSGLFGEAVSEDDSLRLRLRTLLIGRRWNALATNLRRLAVTSQLIRSIPMPAPLQRLRVTPAGDSSTQCLAQRQMLPVL